MIGVEGLRNRKGGEIKSPAKLRTCGRRREETPHSYLRANAGGCMSLATVCIFQCEQIIETTIAICIDILRSNLFFIILCRAIIINSMRFAIHPFPLLICISHQSVTSPPTSGKKSFVRSTPFILPSTYLPSTMPTELEEVNLKNPCDQIFIFTD
jgi:hypothetical protein